MVGMKSSRSLNGAWQLRILGDNVYGIPSDYMDALVPGTVYTTLVESGRMPDPFYRDNELTALKLMENDFEYKVTFMVSQEELEAKALMLAFDGIDTIGDIYLNGELIDSVKNMFRKFEYNVLNKVQLGENELKIVLHSPTDYIAKEDQKVFVGGTFYAMKGYSHLRKAHCMFGWDWGPRLPDAGIYRDVSLVSYQEGRIDSVYVTQKHEADSVVLNFKPELTAFVGGFEGEVTIKVTAPDQTVYTCLATESMVIDNPQLWWPNNLGEQPLYQVEAVLVSKENVVLDTWTRKIGLRTITVKREKDSWGESFCHEINGVSIFAMGADYIPEDNLFGRINEERTRSLLLSAKEANHNCVRVWGGGYYPDDYFYGICDELGLLVWQDFMFACALYELDDEFEENISIEIEQNIKRIRHHASLALWCGNNEMETQTMENKYKPSEKQRYDYIKIFEYIIPKIVKQEDPNTFYWPSSPSSGGNFDNPWDENSGDTHYWDVWHGNKPITEFRKFYFRYVSEFGFQSFPSMKTIQTFTEEKDRNIFSRIMEMHQRNQAANGKILNYVSATYLYPSSFDNLVYTSQLLQAEAIRYGVEHWRRNRGRCMGAVVWQLNDIWPVASWASIDYFGRWKALHYAEKRFFNPIMISCDEVGEVSERPFCIMQPKEIEKSATLCVTNETLTPVTGVVRWVLRNPDASIVVNGEETITVDALSSNWLSKLDFTKYDELKHYISYEFEVAGDVVTSGTCLFTNPKHYPFENPNLSYRIEGQRVIISADAYAKYIEIECEDCEIRLSDNYFDMNAGTKEITVLSGNPKTLKLRSVFDIDK